jgi:hypothetical protein
LLNIRRVKNRPHSTLTRSSRKSKTLAEAVITDVLYALQLRLCRDSRDRALLTDMSVEGFVILGYCRQRPAAIIHEATTNAYRGLRSLRRHTIDAPVEIQQRPEVT